MLPVIHLSGCSSEDHYTAMGSEVLVAKFDTESAYRLIPVHSDDRPLLGMMWRDKLYVDTTLPFGLRSAPKILNAVADALQWPLAVM